MSRVIRIDNEVWVWLKLQGHEQDTPNAVLRKLAGLAPRKRLVLQPRRLRVKGMRRNRPAVLL